MCLKQGVGTIENICKREGASRDKVRLGNFPKKPFGEKYPLVKIFIMFWFADEIFYQDSMLWEWKIWPAPGSTEAKIGNGYVRAMRVPFSQLESLSKGHKIHQKGSESL